MEGKVLLWQGTPCWGGSEDSLRKSCKQKKWDLSKSGGTVTTIVSAGEGKKYDYRIIIGRYFSLRIRSRVSESPKRKRKNAQRVRIETY